MHVSSGPSPLQLHLAAPPESPEAALEVVKHLMANGADPNAQKGSKGENALHRA